MQSLTLLHRMAKNPDLYVTEVIAQNPQARNTKPEEFLKRLTVGGIANATGFLAEVYRDNPEKREEWIKTTIEGEDAQQSVIHALALAGLQQLAVTAMQQYGWSAERINRAIGPGGSMSRIPPIWDYRPGVPADMDMFWGAFAASGKEQYVLKVLDIYTSVAAQPRIKVEDIEFVAERMLRGEVTRELFDRFLQYPEQERIWLVSAGTALWGLGSQAAQHARVKEIVVKHFDRSKKTEADWALARHMVRGSKKVLFVGRRESSSIMVAFTHDVNFSQTELPKWLKSESAHLSDKIFRRSDRPYMAIIGIALPRSTMQVQSELIDPNGRRVGQGTHFFPSGQQKAADNATVTSTLVSLGFKPDSATGFYKNRFVVKSDRDESFTGEIEFLLQE